MLPAPAMPKRTPLPVWVLLPIVLVVAVVLAALTGIGGGSYALIFVIAIIIAVAGLIDYRFCVLALILVFPLTGTYFFPRKLFGLTGLNPFNVLLVFAVLSVAVYHIFALRPRQHPRPDLTFFWPLVLVLAVAALIGSSSVHKVPAFFHLKSQLFETRIEYFRDVFVKPLLIFVFVTLIAMAVARTKDKRIWVPAVLVGGSTLSALIILYVARSGAGIGAMSASSAREFLSPLGMHANELGVALVPLFSACLFVLPSQRRARAFVPALVLTAMVFLTIMLTFSRAAFLATVIVAFLFAVKRKRLQWVLLGLIALSASILFAPEPIKERVTRGFETGFVGGRNSAMDPLTAGRVGGIWTPLFSDIKAHALIGNGVHSTLWSSAARSGQIYVTHPHNAYIRLIMDHGLVFGSLVLYFLWRTWRLWRRVADDPEADPLLRAFFDGICAGFLAFLAQAISGSTLIFEPAHAMFLFAIGLALGVLARRPSLARQSKMVAPQPSSPLSARLSS